MLLRRLSILAAACFVGLLSSGQSIWAAAAVNYEGFLYEDVFSFVPVVNGTVIAGTLKPGFDPDSIQCLYGDDVCNVANDYWALAVADGNIIPIGDGDLTDGNGFFSGTGMTDAPAGTQLYLFAFPYSELGTGSDGVLATGPSEFFSVPPANGSVTIYAEFLNDFTFGFSHADGMALGLLPFPEPHSCALLIVGSVLLGVAGRTER